MEWYAINKHSFTCPLAHRGQTTALYYQFTKKINMPFTLSSKHLGVTEYKLTIDAHILLLPKCKYLFLAYQVAISLKWG